MGLQVDPKELKKRQFFLEGNIPKAVLSVCLPMALFQLINELFRVFDLVITSQINPESVSAVSFFNQLNNSIVSVGTGLSIGAGILIAGLYGAGEYERLKTTVNTTFFMAGAAALVLVAGLILGARPILRLANTPAQLVEIGLNYYRITALNLFFTFFNNVYIAIEKARGNGSKIMRINFAMALTKFSFSAFFVLVLHQGIVMIGVATLLSNLVVTAIGLYNLRNPEDVFGLSFRYVRLKNDIVKKIVSISLPVIAEKFSFSAGKVVVNSVGVNYGTQTVGALGVSNSVSALSTVPAGSIGDGGAALIRQNIGHGNPQRALKIFRCVFIVDFVWGVLGFILTWVFLDPILASFSKGDVAFAELIAQIFTLEMISNVFLAIHSAVMALLYAFGYTKLSFCVNFARLFVFRIPILLFFQHCTTLAGGQAMGLVMMISNGMTGLLALVVAAAVLHKEYGAGWMKQLLST